MSASIMTMTASRRWSSSSSATGRPRWRKCSEHPRFIGKTVRFSEAELRDAADLMWATFERDRVLESVGVAANRVDARVAVPRAEFEALVARKGFKIPDAVALEYAVQTPAQAINAPLPPDIARLVRVFRATTGPAARSTRS